jgi:hypothetical protein
MANEEQKRTKKIIENRKEYNTGRSINNLHKPRVAEYQIHQISTNQTRL